MTLDGLLALVKGLAAFGLVITLWSVALLLWSRRRRGEREAIARRLGTAPEAAPQDGAGRTLRLWHEGREATTRVPGLRAAPGLLVRLERMCRDAGWSAPPRSILAAVGAGSLAVALATALATGRLFPSVVGGAGVVLVFVAVARKRATARARLFERQLVDALELSARALRAGHPLLASFELIATEIPAPVGGVFGGLVQQQSLGMPLDECLRRASAEAGSPDLDLFAAAMSIHSRTGGNLADVMTSLALVIRERMRLGRRFRVLVAQTQVSKRILIAMPIVMFGVLHLISPEYMEELYATSAGQFILFLAIGSLTCGWFVMNRMADLRP